MLSGKYQSGVEIARIQSHSIDGDFTEASAIELHELNKILLSIIIPIAIRIDTTS